MTNTEKEKNEAKLWNHPVTFSLAYRFVLNVASPSHELATGEYTEHKKADIYWNGRLYTNVPIISGNAVRRYIKDALRDIALKENINLGKLCRNGVYTHWNRLDDMKKDVGPNVQNFIKGLKECIMEDVSGFMLAEKNKSAIRFSRLHVSMVKPVYKDLEKVSVYHIQFARHDIRRSRSGDESNSSSKSEKAEKGKSAQMPFRVEHISGRFAGVVALDAHLIGYDDIGYDNSGPRGYFLKKKEVIKRVKVAVKAIYDGIYNRFGSMKARSLSVIKPDTAAIVIVKGSYIPPDPSLCNDEGYVEMVKKDLMAYARLMGADSYMIYVVSKDCDKDDKLCMHKSNKRGTESSLQGKESGCVKEEDGIECINNNGCDKEENHPKVIIMRCDTIAEAFTKAIEVITNFMDTAVPADQEKTG